MRASHRRSGHRAPLARAGQLNDHPRGRRRRDRRLQQPRHPARLRRAPRRVPWVSVTVVDNASPDDSAAVVADLPIHTIRAPQKRRFRIRLQPRVRRRHCGIRSLPEPGRGIESPSLRTLVTPFARTRPRGRRTADARRWRRTSRDPASVPPPSLHLLPGPGPAPRRAASELGRRGDPAGRTTMPGRATPDWLSGRMRADAQGRARRGRRPGRGLLPVLRGDRSVSPPPRPGLASALRAAATRTTRDSDRRPGRDHPILARAGSATRGSITARWSAFWRRSV